MEQEEHARLAKQETCKYVHEHSVNTLVHGPRYL
jgi:hypothetical protein